MSQLGRIEAAEILRRIGVELQRDDLGVARIGPVGELQSPQPGRRAGVRVVCAWCEPTPASEVPISHGICAPCAQRFFGFVGGTASVGENYLVNHLPKVAAEKERARGFGRERKVFPKRMDLATASIGIGLSPVALMPGQ